MDFYVGCLAAIWLAAASATVWVYQIRARDAAAQLEQTTVDLSSRIVRLQADKERVEAKYRAKAKETELLAAQKAASAEVELQREPVKKTWTSWKKKADDKQCKPKKKHKHKHSREWDD